MGALGSTASECAPEHVPRVCAPGQGDVQEGPNSPTGGNRQYFVAQGEGGAGAKAGGTGNSREGSRDGAALPVELGDLRLHQEGRDAEFDEPPLEGDDEDCDMKLWSALPDTRSKGQSASGRKKPPTESLYGNEMSDAAHPPPPPTGLHLSAEEQEDPPMPNLVNSYFDEDIGEGPRHDDSAGGRKRFVFHSGAEYDGDWQGGHRHGVGRQTWPDTAEYIGEWNHGRASGNGRMRHADGDVYSGQWVNGRAHGEGVYRFQGGNAVYEGEFKCDLRDGTGVEVWVDGSWYAGEFRKGAKHGMGQHTWPDGTCYSGCWNNNELAGVGRYEVTNGPRYQGHWKDSIIHGFGIYTWPDGRRYEGHYEVDKKQGFGVIFDEDGQHRSGWWESGKMLKRQRADSNTNFPQYKKGSKGDNTPPPRSSQ